MRSRLISAAVILMTSALGSSGCSMPTPVRVMSFNIRTANIDDGENSWERRRSAAAEAIRAFAPDVCGLQEVVGVQVEQMKADLKDYAWVLEGDEHARQDGERCPIIYRKDRFFVMRTGMFWLSDQPERPHVPGWDAALPRMATWARLRYKSNPLAEIVVINTHFDHVGREARLESARLIRRMTDGLAGEPIIVLGDFNASADSPPYEALTRNARNLAELRDTYRWLSLPEENTRTYHAFRGTLDGPRIDWILVNRRFRVLEAGIMRDRFDGLYPSDHFPVTAVVELKPATDTGAL